MEKQLFMAFLSILLLNSLPAQFVTSQKYGRNSKHLERLAGAVPTADGGLLVGGYKEAGAQGVYDIFLQKFRTDGTESWLKTIGRDSLDVLTDLVPANGGGFLLSGYTLNPANGSFDALLAKVDEQGNLLWWKPYGGPATEIGLALCQLSDQNIVLAGSTITSDNRSAHFRALFDAEGKLLDAANMISSRDVSAIQLEATSDGGPLAFWTGALSGLQVQLEHFAQELRDEDLSLMAHPHPISGPLDLRQRLEFLRFHLDRHRGQVLERWALISG